MCVCVSIYIYIYISIYLSLVQGVFKASRQKVNVGGTSTNERGDGRAYDPAYV